MPDNKYKDENKYEDPIELNLKAEAYTIGIFNKDDADKSFYLGRKQQISRLVNILTMSAGHSSTLITGHRGAGKTAFVYECIRRTKSLGIIRFMQEPLLVRWVNIILFLAVILCLDSLLTKVIANFVAIKDTFFTSVTAISFLLLYLVTTIFNQRHEVFFNKPSDAGEPKIWIRDIIIVMFVILFITVFSLYYWTTAPFTPAVSKPWYLSLIGFFITAITVSLLFIFDYRLLFKKQFEAQQPLQPEFVNKARYRFFYSFLRFWTPTLVVHANLGFNNISHKTVINALLTGLRHEYRATFLSPLRLRFWVFLLVPLWLAVHIASGAENWLIERIVKSKEHDRFKVEHDIKTLEIINTLHSELVKDRELVKDGEEEKTNALKELLTQTCGILRYKKESGDRICGYTEEMNVMRKLLSDAGIIKENKEDKEDKANITTSTSDNGSNNATSTKKYTARGFLDYKRFLGEHDFLLKTIKAFKKANKYDEYLRQLEHERDHDNGFLNDIFLIDLVYLYDTSEAIHIPKNEAEANNTLSVLKQSTYPHRTVAYVIFLLVFFFIFYYLLLNLSPYTRTYKRIRSLNIKLNASLQLESGVTATPSSGGLGGVFSRKNTQTYQPLDSKSVEILFTNLLKEMSEFRFFKTFLPKPKLIFVLDELDKLGAKLDFTAHDNNPVHRDTLNPGVTKREASVEHLLADMKNILSSGAASFICIGGRELQDKWLADQTERMPLLTSVFDSCIYIPNLLASGSNDKSEQAKKRKLSYYVGQLLQGIIKGSIEKWIKLHDVAKTPLFSSIGLQRINNSIYQHLNEQKDQENSRAVHKLLQSFPEEEKALSVFRLYWEKIKIAFNQLFKKANKESKTPDETTNEVKHQDRYDKELFAQFIRFLSYRSQGNPKKLHELIAAYTSNNKDRPHQHILQFTDEELMNIQLLSGVFGLIETALGRDVQVRDDKVITAIFHLADFLFKFHKRAFSWDSLEKIDELADIHRAPDIHQILKMIVKSFEDLFLHPVFNGLYSYKFRREVANEIKFISKSSASAMAAFNFTLDESLPLRVHYIEKLKMSKSEAGRGDPDIIASLGELYEFDELYDSARKEYNRAIHELDSRILTLTDHGEVTAKEILTEVLSCKDIYFPMVVSWIFSRLKLMMQVGMTYEQSGNLERAFYTYSEAKAFADLALNALFFTAGRGKNSAIDPILFQSIAKTDPLAEYDFPKIESENIIEHFDLLFQPFLAKAWVQEKLVMAVHSSGKYLDDILDSYDQVLGIQPAKGNDTKCAKNAIQRQLTPDASKKSFPSANYLGAELYNRAGDLLFLKGKAEIVGEDANYLQQAIEKYRRALKLAFEGILDNTINNNPDDSDKALYDKCSHLPRYNSALIIKNLLDFSEAVIGHYSVTALVNFANEELKKYWPLNKNDVKDSVNANQIREGLKEDTKPTENGLTLYLSCNHLAISMLVNSGFRETAASEAIQVTHFLMQLILLSKIDNKQKLDALLDNEENLLRLAGRLLKKTWEITPYLDKEHKNKRSVSRYFLDLIRESCCYLMLCPTNGEDFNEKTTIKERIKEYAQHIGYSQHNIVEHDYHPFLQYVIDFNRYPVLFRLQTVAMSLTIKLLSEDTEVTDDFIKRVDELAEWQKSYDSSILFSPATVGIIQVLLAEKLTVQEQEQKRKAHNNIQRSINTYSMGADYYKAIEGMYYLYDDFNDRKLHYQFAMLMMADEVLKNLLKRVKPDR